MDITILYGSQTGNAEDMAKRIGYMAKVHGYRVLVEAADDFQLKLLPSQNLLIFVCSTTGHGQEPENMKNFYNFIRRRDLPKDCLSKLKYVVYGLGDSSYAKFNYVSKILYKRLKECGAEPLQSLVTGDEQHRFGCDGIIYPSLNQLWDRLANVHNFKKSISSNMLQNDLPQNSYSVILIDESNGVQQPDDFFSPKLAKRYNLHSAVCFENKRMTDDSHFQDTRFLSFKTKDDIHYEPGDVVCILPANSDDNVDTFVQLLNLDPKQRFRLSKNDPNYMIDYLYDFVPEGLAIRDLVKFYLDIQSVPKRSFFEFLWPFSDNELERDKLKEFASTEGQEEMFDYCIQPKRSILEVLVDFPNTVSKIKFEYIFDLIPPIKPRSFSIASSVSLYTNEVQLIVGKVEYQTRLRKTRRGLCSTYLASLQTTNDLDDTRTECRLNFYIKQTSFKLPENDDTPIILIGPGLGIAPLRSFIQERMVRQTQENTDLYFGCRYRNKDFYFREELKNYVDSGLIRLRVAFSRDDQKQYVQDLLSEDSNMIRGLVKDEGCIIYVAGNSKLPEELRTLFGKILSDDGGDTDTSNGEMLVSSLEAQNRIQYDCW